MRAHALLLLTLTLGGCSLSGVVTDWVSDDVAGPEPVNYRFMIAASLNGIIGPQDTASRILEISSPRRVDTAKGATWAVCVKSLRQQSQLPRAYYSVFFQREKIVESRLSVGSDLCESQPYSTFDWSVDVNRPVATPALR